MRRFTVESFRAAPLETIDHHIMTSGIERLAVSGIPLHCALHSVNVEQNQHIYSLTHRHEADDELNIIINDQGHELTYRFVVDGETFELSAPASVWIPAGIDHEANVIKGRGTFVCLRFPK